MGNAVVTFDQVHVLAPRGRFEVEMYLSSLKLTGQVRCHFQHLCCFSAQACCMLIRPFGVIESGLSKTKPSFDGQLHNLLALRGGLLGLLGCCPIGLGRCGQGQLAVKLAP